MSTSEREAYMLEQGQDLMVENASDFYRNNPSHSFSETALPTDAQRAFIKAPDKPSALRAIRLTFVAPIKANATKADNDTSPSASVYFDPNSGAVLGYTRTSGVWLPVINHQGPRPNEYYSGYLCNKELSRYRSVVNRCIEVIQQLEPECYEADSHYNISEVIYNNDGTFDSVSQHNGRHYYVVYFSSSNRLKRIMNGEDICLHSAIISLWKDTGEVWRAEFGNDKENQEHLFLTQPYK